MDGIFFDRNGVCLRCGGTKKCISCNGTGEHPHLSNRQCPDCKGGGECFCVLLGKESFKESFDPQKQGTAS